MARGKGGNAAPRHLDPRTFVRYFDDCYNHALSGEGRGMFKACFIGSFSGGCALSKAVLRAGQRPAISC